MDDQECKLPTVSVNSLLELLLTTGKMFRTGRMTVTMSLISENN